jgi:hypothetical protein
MLRLGCFPPLAAEVWSGAPVDDNDGLFNSKEASTRNKVALLLFYSSILCVQQSRVF